MIKFTKTLPIRHFSPTFSVLWIPAVLLHLGDLNRYAEGPEFYCLAKRSKNETLFPVGSSLLYFFPQYFKTGCGSIKSALTPSLLHGTYSLPLQRYTFHIYSFSSMTKQSNSLYIYNIYSSNKIMEFLFKCIFFLKKQFFSFLDFQIILMQSTKG